MIFEDHVTFFWKWRFQVVTIHISQMKGERLLEWQW